MCFGNVYKYLDLSSLQQSGFFGWKNKNWTKQTLLFKFDWTKSNCILYSFFLFFFFELFTLSAVRCIQTVWISRELQGTPKTNTYYLLHFGCSNGKTKTQNPRKYHGKKSTRVYVQENWKVKLFPYSVSCWCTVDKKKKNFSVRIFVTFVKLSVFWHFCGIVGM